MVWISIEIIILIYSYFIILGIMRPYDRFQFKKNKGIIFGFLFLSLVIFSFYITPSESSDLLFYFRQVIRGQSEEISEILNFQKNPLIVWHFITFIVGRIGNEHFLTSTMVGITILFWIQNIKITTDSIKISNRAFSLYFVLFVGVFTWTNLFSGLRNTAAFSIMAWIVTYNFLLNKKKMGLTIELALCAVCCLIHPATIIVLGFYIVSRYLLKKWYAAIILAVWPWALGFTERILSNANSAYSQYLVEKIHLYSSDVQYHLSIAFPKYIFILLFTFGLLYYRKKWEELDLSTQYYNFLICNCLFTLGAYNYPNIVNRMSLIIALTMLPAIQVFLKTKLYVRVLVYGASVVFVAGFTAYNYVRMFSHMTIG